MPTKVLPPKIALPAIALSAVSTLAVSLHLDSVNKLGHITIVEATGAYVIILSLVGITARLLLGSNGLIYSTEQEEDDNKELSMKALEHCLEPNKKRGRSKTRKRPKSNKGKPKIKWTSPASRLARRISLMQKRNAEVKEDDGGVVEEVT